MLLSELIQKIEKRENATIINPINVPRVMLVVDTETPLRRVYGAACEALELHGDMPIFVLQHFSKEKGKARASKEIFVARHR